MKFTGTIDAEHHVVIPDSILRTFQLSPGDTVEVEVSATETPAQKRARSERLKAVLDEYQGSMRGEMLAAGYASVDELMDDIRPR